MYYSAFVCGGALTAWLTDVFLIVLGQHQSSVVRWGQDTQTTLVTRISSSLVWGLFTGFVDIEKKNTKHRWAFKHTNIICTSVCVRAHNVFSLCVRVCVCVSVGVKPHE